MANQFLLLGVVVVVLVLLAVYAMTKKRGSSAQVEAEVALKEAQYQPFKLIQRTQVTHNTIIFRFQLAHPKQRVGLPVGKHMLLKFIDVDGKPISRPYTPVSSDDDLGYFDLLIKLYPNGKMSQHLQHLQVGQTIEARGPQGSLEYLGGGEFTVKRSGGRVQKVNCQNVGMIAGGSGITPMLQILREVHKHASSDFTKLSLLFANVTEADILMKEELDKLKESRSLTEIVYTLDKPAETWTGPKGFVTTELIKQHLPPPSSSTMILLCGPKPMVDAMEKNLLSLGYTEDMYFKY